MKNLTLAIAGSIVVVLVISGIVSTAVTPDSRRVNQQRSEADQVVESFERELNHQPAPATRASRDAIEDDILYKTVNEIHWSPDARSNSEEKSDEHIDETNSLEEPGLESGRQVDE